MAKKLTLASKNPYEKIVAPIVFADQPSALLLGAVVSRITFGVHDADGSDYPRPVVTIAMPTDSLMQLVLDLKLQFDDPDFRKHCAESLLKSAQIIAKGGKATSQGDMVKLPGRKPTN
jgi:hypothetical protein